MSVFVNVTTKTLLLPRDDGKGGWRDVAPGEQFQASNFYKQFLVDPATNGELLRVVIDDGDEKWAGIGGYIGRNNPILSPNTVTRYAYVTNSDIGECYVNGSQGEVKIAKTFLNGAEVGDLAKKICYFYQDAANPTKVTRMEQIDDVVNEDDISFVCSCVDLSITS